MSRNMRAVKVEWSECASVFMPSDDFEKLAAVLIDEMFQWSCEWSEPDEVFKFRTAQGHRFLDRIRGCKPRYVAQQFPEGIRNDVIACLENLQAMESDWRTFVEEDGSLEIWIDGY